MSQFVWSCGCGWKGLSVRGALGRRGQPPESCPRCDKSAFTVRSEHYPQITRTCEDCHRDYLCHRDSRWCERCRWRHRGKRPMKYVWTPELDAILKAEYDGKIRYRAAAIASRLGWPAWVIKKRAGVLGLAVPADRRDWTPKETRFVSFYAGHRTTLWMARRLRRSESSVVLKLKRMKISRRIRKGYTMRDLELCFGVDHRPIERWVRQGLLTIRHRHPKRPHPTWWVKDEDILAFIQGHPMAFRLDKVDQFWFMDLILDGGLVQKALAGERRVEARSA